MGDWPLLGTVEQRGKLPQAARQRKTQGRLQGVLEPQMVMVNAGSADASGAVKIAKSD